MEILQTQYYKSYKLILIFLGQWPTQPAYQRWCMRCICLSFVFSIFIPTIIKLFELTDNSDLFIECMTTVCLHSVGVTKYITWIVNFKKLKKLFHLIEQNGNMIKKDNDIKIMEVFMKRVQIITAAYTTALYSCLVLYLALPLIPKFLDIIKPLNESRDSIYLYQTEYFVDPDEYYTPILIHAYITMPFTMAMIIFYDNVIAICVQHACGIFSIAGLYLKRIHLDAKNIRLNYDQSQVIHRNISQSVKMHRRALKFISVLESLTNVECMTLLLLNLFIITLTGMAAIQKIHRLSDSFRFFAYCSGAIFHLFYNCYQGQELIEQSQKIFTAVYSSEWYNYPPYLQRLLIPIMMKSKTPCQLTAAKMATMSMDTFSIVLKNAMSFFTVLTSVQ